MNSPPYPNKGTTTDWLFPRVGVESTFPLEDYADPVPNRTHTLSGLNQQNLHWGQKDVLQYAE